MKAVIQRVKYAKLSVEGKLVSQINVGLLVLLVIGQNDTQKDVEYFTDKISKLRIFEDQNQKMNLSVNDVNGEILLVSNFTLYGQTKGTNRPSFSSAGSPDFAKPMFDTFAEVLNQKVPTKTGIFGADMQIVMCADGPVTILMGED